MKTYRDRFIRNHRPELQVAQNKKGYRKVLIYTGDFYTWEPPKFSIKTIRLIFLILEILTIIIFVLSSIPGTVISYSNLAMSTVILAFAAWVFEVIGAVRFCFKTLPLEEDDYAYIRTSFYITFPLRFACMIFTVITGTIFMNEKGVETTGVLAIIGYCITALLAITMFILFLWLQKHKKVIAGENTTKKQEKEK